MSDPLTVEFYKMAAGGTVGTVLETVLLPADAFASQNAFKLWAQEALPARRADNRIWEWPDAVRVCSADGQQLYCWTAWDQIQAGKALASNHRP